MNRRHQSLPFTPSSYQCSPVKSDWQMVARLLCSAASSSGSAHSLSFASDSRLVAWFGNGHMSRRRSCRREARRGRGPWKACLAVGSDSDSSSPWSSCRSHGDARLCIPRGSYSPCPGNEGSSLTVVSGSTEGLRRHLQSSALRHT